MGLSFKNKHTQEGHVSSSRAVEELTRENRRFLQKVGFKLNDYGHIGYNPRTDFRRDLVGKGIPHAQPLRFIKIK
jgi:hypothetical protein